MYRGNMFSDYQMDPFYNMPQMQSPFDQMIMGNSMLAHQAQQRQMQNQSNSLFPFGGMSSMFGGMDQMMNQMMNMQRQTIQNPAAVPNGGQFYSSSSFYSYDSRNGGDPHVYQAHSSSLQGPGGVRATRKAVSDSRSGEEKMSVGQHIGNRGYVREKRRNRRTNDEEESEDLHEIDHGDLDGFQREFHGKLGRSNLAIREKDQRRSRHRSDQRAVTDGSHQ